MNDVESLVRDTLREDVGSWSAEGLLDDVRRGVRRRRRRRATLVVVAAVVALGGVGGGVAWRGHHTHAAERPHLTLTVGATDVDVTTDGTIVEVVANQGCQAPCSSVLIRRGPQTWQPALTVRDASPQGRLYSPLRLVAMTPDGEDGWAWGNQLWSTHDRGQTWSRVTSLPGWRHPYGSPNLDLVPGNHYTWAAVTVHDRRELWRTPTASDRWVRMPTPPAQWDDLLSMVLPDSRLAVQVDSGHHVMRQGRRVGTAQDYWITDGRATQQVSVRCVKRRVPFAAMPVTADLCGPGGRFEGLGGITGPRVQGESRFRNAVIPAGMTPTRGSMPLGNENVIDATANEAFLVTPHATIPLDLGVGAITQLAGWAQQGRRIVIVTRDRRLFTSNDGGHTWFQQ